jgi:hypothetical protein
MAGDSINRHCVVYINPPQKKNQVPNFDHHPYLTFVNVKASISWIQLLYILDWDLAIKSWRFLHDCSNSILNFADRKPPTALSKFSTWQPTCIGYPAFWSSEHKQQNLYKSQSPETLGSLQHLLINNLDSLYTNKHQKWCATNLSVSMSRRLQCWKMYTIFFFTCKQAQAYESNTTFKCQFTKENSSNNSRLSF